MEILSPLTQTNKTQKIHSYTTKKINQQYRNLFGIDVTSYFHDQSEIGEYKCIETGYCFYVPFDIGGDGLFYSHFQQYNWYYIPWKWEHKQAANFVKPGMKILEVGCGPGGFLKEIIKKVPNVLATGLELNMNAIEQAQNAALHVLPEMIESHATKHSNTYDMVCSFQVLEHISAVHSFLEAQIKTLKKGGTLLISVPNNDSFPKYDSKNDVLNLPPHHMGKWSPASLQSIERLFPVKLIKQLNEPLQPYHIDWYMQIMERRAQCKAWWMWRLLTIPAIQKAIRWLLRHFSFIIKGHTTIALFKKL